MDQIIIVVHILLGLSIIGLIMMQQGKGADAGAGFGGGASGSVFGAQGSASFLSRMTAIFAALFFATSLGLAWINGHKSAPVAVDILGTEQAPVDSVLPNIDEKAAEPVLSVPPAQNKTSVPAQPDVTQSSPAPQESSSAPASAPAVEKPTDAAPVSPALEQHEKAQEEKAPAKHKTEHHGKKAAKAHQKHQ